MESMGKTLNKAAIVVVTYKRQELLTGLFDSILKLTQAPWRIVVVDNENSADTRTMVEQFSERVTGRWGRTIIDGSGNQDRVVYLPQDHNGGGAGGFSAGVRKAYELGAKCGSGSWMMTLQWNLKDLTCWLSGVTAIRWCRDPGWIMMAAPSIGNIIF